jgi:hypothetical protein
LANTLLIPALSKHMHILTEYLTFIGNQQLTNKLIQKYSDFQKPNIIGELAKI